MAEPRIARLDEVASAEEIARLPYSLRVLLENVLRAGEEKEVRAVLERAARRGAAPGDLLPPRARPAPGLHRRSRHRRSGRDARRDARARRRARQINPLRPSDLVIDHSVQVDAFGSRSRLQEHRARVRAQPRALRLPALGPGGLRQLPCRPAGHRHRPPGQPRISRRVVCVEDAATRCVSPTPSSAPTRTPRWSTASACLGWGVGGIEAEAAMLGQPFSMLVPQVVGFRLSGAPARGRDGDRPRPHRHGDASRARRRRQVRRVLGAGLAGLAARRPRDDRNMSPEYGATCGFFPVDEETLPTCA